MTGSVVQDMASGGNITSVNTALSENHQSTASQQYRGMIGRLEMERHVDHAMKIIFRTEIR